MDLWEGMELPEAELVAASVKGEVVEGGSVARVIVGHEGRRLVSSEQPIMCVSQKYRRNAVYNYLIVSLQAIQYTSLMVLMCV